MDIRGLISDGTSVRQKTGLHVDDIDAPSVPRTEDDPETSDAPGQHWRWYQVTLDEGGDKSDTAALIELARRLNLDEISMNDAVTDFDLPKFDDFGNGLVAVLHGASSNENPSLEVDCFMKEQLLVTVCHEKPDYLDRLWKGLRERRDAWTLTIDEVLALVADSTTRSLLDVGRVYDRMFDRLFERALAADRTLLGDLTALRRRLSRLDSVAGVQTQVLARLRNSTSKLVTMAGRRRFADAYDLSMRVDRIVETMRGESAEALDAYRGAQDQRSTVVTTVLTIYSAVMLPLTVIGGYFGMNFENLPLIGRSWGWWVVTLLMVVLAMGSIGLFVVLGWIRRPSGKTAGVLMGLAFEEAGRDLKAEATALTEFVLQPIRHDPLRPGDVARMIGQDTDSISLDEGVLAERDEVDLRADKEAS